MIRDNKDEQGNMVNEQETIKHKKVCQYHKSTH